jgi:hypothetical protein
MSRFTLISCAVVLFAVTGRLAAGPESGPADFSDAKKHVKVTAGEGIKFESDFYRFEFGGKVSLAASGNLKNTTDKKLHGALYIAFFDKDKNLVASGSRTSITLNPGMQLLAANVLELPAEQIDRIASYQITIFESDKELGKK